LLKSNISPFAEPSHSELALSQALAERIKLAISQHRGEIGFDQFMQMALYEPGLGYYSGTRSPFGAQGDFVTAPMISPLFAQCLSVQITQWFEQCPAQITEFGAGDGTLAAQLISQLSQGLKPLSRYTIIEVSAQLRERQKQTIAKLCPQGLGLVQWLNTLPKQINGVVLGNELLDAMPVQIFTLQEKGIYERVVRLAGNTGNSADTAKVFNWAERPASPQLEHEVKTTLNLQQSYPVGFHSELGLQASAWVASIGERLGKGALLLIDYGFTNSEFYIPERSGGTLMCHYRHQAHTDPFWLPGLQDITAHIDFSAIANVGVQIAKLDLAGYTTQAHFLIGCDLASHAQQALSQADTFEAIKINRAIQTLVTESEMGELFKVIAFTRGIDQIAVGFKQGDRSHRLDQAAHV
jgi:SAM-dependent MidA family methyltransferase